MAPSAPSTTLLARVHALLGAALGAYLVFHLVQCWTLLDHPSQYLIGAAARLEAGSGRSTAVLVLALLLLHGGIGVRRALRAGPGDGGDGARGLLTIQLATGGLAAAFVAYHLVQVGAFASGPQLGAHSGYGALAVALATPGPIIAYVVGLTVLCFHVAHGLSRAFGPRLAASLAVRLIAGAAGFLLWGLWLQPLSRLALGRALW